MAKARLDLIGIIVKDMAKSLAFYRALGLDIPQSADSEGHAEITLEGGLRLAWDTHEVIRSFDSQWQPPEGHHRIGLAFLYDSPQAVNELFKSLIDSGYQSHKEPFDAFWGQRYAQVYDPDGNIIDLFAYLPTSDT